MRQCVTLVEEKSIDVGPGGGMVKGFGQDVAGILLVVNEVEMDEAGCNGLMDTVIGLCIPMLGEGGVGNGRACDDTLVVTKQTRQGHPAGHPTYGG